MKRFRVAAVISFALVLTSAFVWLVWPTPWRTLMLVDLPGGPYTARQHRVTGTVRVLCVDGWHTLEEDPFDFLQPANRSLSDKQNPCLSAPLVQVPPRYRR